MVQTSSPMHLPVIPIIDLLSQRLLTLHINHASLSTDTSPGHAPKEEQHIYTAMPATQWPPTQIHHSQLSPTELNRLVFYLKAPADQAGDEEPFRNSDPNSSPSDEAIALVNHILASRVSHHGPLSRSIIETLRNNFTRSWLLVMVGLASEDDTAEARVRAFLPKEVRQITCDYARSLDRELFHQELLRFARTLSPTNGEEVGSGRESAMGEVRPPRALTSAAVAYIRSWLLCAAIAQSDLPDADYSMDHARRIMAESIRLACGLKQHILSTDDNEDDAEERVEELLEWFDSRMRHYVESGPRGVPTGA